ncbi:MAG: helix-turn-helix domain-containing protein [Xanthobacteraceae bacterium]
MPMTVIHDTAHDVLLTEAQAADFLSLSMRTLQAWRVRGSGPNFCRLGRAVRYRRSDLLAWIDASMAASTTEADARANRRDGTR